MAKLPGSRLDVLTDDKLETLLSRLPGVPAHLLLFFEKFGCGRIGNSRYMLYPLISPVGIFDKKTATSLHDVLLIGDDFAGCHEAYRIGRRWEFGTVGDNGRFTPHSKYANILDLIEDWFTNE
jgi:hypothetical protein